jgi:excisionase family DNA binding protein
LTIEVTQRLVTTAEAARLLGVTPSSIRRAVEAGRLRGQKMGNTWLIEESSLFGWRPRHKRGQALVR